MNTTHLNKAIQHIGMYLVSKYFEELYKTCNNLQVISVGSGDGFVERLLEKDHSKEIICVDPIKYNKDPEEYKTSTFNDVDHLLTTSPTYKNNCMLFLNWSTPNNSSYDFDAIQKLKPNHCVIIFESTGSAGGKNLQKWLNYCGIVTDDKPTDEDISKFINKYYVVAQTIYRKKTPYDMYEFQIVWLSKDHIEIEHTLPSNVGEDIEHESVNPIQSILGMLSQFNSDDGCIPPGTYNFQA